MVIMASSITRGAHTLHNDDKVVQHGGHTSNNIFRPRHAALVNSIHLWYWPSLLQSIDTSQNRVFAEKRHMTIPLRLKFRAH